MDAVCVFLYCKVYNGFTLLLVYVYWITIQFRALLSSITRTITSLCFKQYVAMLWFIQSVRCHRKNYWEEKEEEKKCEIYFVQTRFEKIFFCSLLITIWQHVNETHILVHSYCSYPWNIMSHCIMKFIVNILLSLYNYCRVSFI